MSGLQPVIPSNSYGQNLGQMNNMIRQLNKEQIVKTFKQPGGNAIIQGKLPYSTPYGPAYGTLKYDRTQLARMIDGTHPDGTMNITISKEGYDVINDLTW